jgi:hypothetical protein
MHASRDRHLRAVDAMELPGDNFVRRQCDLFDHLIPYVGSADALWRLDTEPLPDEPFDWSAVEDRDRSFVEEVLAQTDQCCELLLDVEYRTITRRILARVAARDPRPFRRRPHAARCAASLVWLACGSSGMFASRPRTPTSWIWSWFAVGNCSDRGRTLRRAAGLEPAGGWYDEPLSLGDPTLLHSHFRETILIERHRKLEIAEERRTWSEDPGGRVSVRHLPAKVVTAVKGVAEETGRALVYVGFGDRIEDAHYVSLTVPEAHELVRKVQLALDAPLLPVS